MNTIVVVPAWNEEQTIAPVVSAVRSFGTVLVVNDGSKDKTEELARSAGAYIVRHAVNRGLGAALITGFLAARRMDADVVVTFDGDGQHVAADIRDMIAPIIEGKTDVVIGSRFLETKGHVPFVRRVANGIGNIVTGVLFGVHVTDSQSGLRAFSRFALEKMQLKTDGMEISSEIIAEIHERKLRYTEVPITAVYTTYSMSKGQGFLMGLKTLGKLIVHRLNR